MINNVTRVHALGAVVALAMSGIAMGQQGRPIPENSHAGRPAVVSQPVRPILSCSETIDDLAAALRSQGFTAQAARDFARLTRDDCANGRFAAAAVQIPRCTLDAGEVSSRLRSEGFTTQAAKNYAYLDSSDC